MSGWLLTPIIVASAFGYVAMGGFIGGRFHQWRTSQCEGCRQRRYCYTDHVTSAVMSGVAWIVLLPVVLGYFAGVRDKKVDRLQADIERLEREAGIR